MKLGLKLALSLVIVVALAAALFTVTSEPASATQPCPTNECPEVLDGYTYLGPCVTSSGGNACLGYAYRKGGESCHVPALGGL